MFLRLMEKIEDDKREGERVGGWGILKKRAKGPVSAKSNCTRAGKKMTFSIAP